MVLRKIYRPNKEITEAGTSCIMKRFIICFLHQVLHILLEWSKKSMRWAYSMH